MQCLLTNIRTDLPQQNIREVKSVLNLNQMKKSIFNKPKYQQHSYAAHHKQQHKSYFAYNASVLHHKYTTELQRSFVQDWHSGSLMIKLLEITQRTLKTCTSYFKKRLQNTETIFML